MKFLWNISKNYVSNGSKYFINITKNRAYDRFPFFRIDFTTNDGKLWAWTVKWLILRTRKYVRSDVRVTLLCLHTFCRVRCVYLCSCNGSILNMEEYGMKLLSMKLILIFFFFSTPVIVKGKCPILSIISNDSIFWYVSSI